MDYEVDTSPLCCCEFIDYTGSRNHILACCCNCQDLDNVFESLVTCRKINPVDKSNMFLTINDRLRIPGFPGKAGGARKIPLEIVIPILLIFLMQSLAAINLYFCVIIHIILPFFLWYFYVFFMKVLPRTKFFCVWLCASSVYLLLLFESIVPLLELLPTENFAFILLLTLTLFCFYKTYQKSKVNRIASTSNEKELGRNGDEQVNLLISDKEDVDHDEDVERNSCQSCRKSVPDRAFHCVVCQTCILKQDHHNVWLYCCIGKNNHKYFIFGCVFALSSLLLFANLTLTSICHPIIFFTVFGLNILLPDDCTDIFDQYEVSLIFVGAVYSITMAMFISISLAQQWFLISRGVTASEWRRGNRNNRSSCLRNWKNFYCC